MMMVVVIVLGLLFVERIGLRNALGEIERYARRLVTIGMQGLGPMARIRAPNFYRVLFNSASFWIDSGNKVTIGIESVSFRALSVGEHLIRGVVAVRPLAPHI